MNPVTRRIFLKSAPALAASVPASITATRAAEAADAPANPPAKEAAAKEPPKDPYGDAILVDGEPPLPVDGAFTIAALPDTQNYSDRYPATYELQTKWIVEQRRRRNIACVLHLGDITDDNSPRQWENAARAMAHLDWQVPCFMAPGNHDYSLGGTASDRTTLFGDYFSTAVMRGQPTFGGFYDREPDRVENSFHLFSAAGRKFLVLCLEFGPRKDVIRWANGVVARHRDREAILVTHAFIYDDDTRYDWKKFGEKQKWNPHEYGVAKSGGDDVTDGEELWQQLVSRHDNFVFTINGHVLHDGLGRVSSTTPTGREVHPILVKFQMRPRGGDGWLRLLEFRTDGSMHTFDYSPLRRQRNESAQNQFAVRLAPVVLA
jgi:Calcineurin-like phosphoesterase